MIDKHHMYLYDNRKLVKTTIVIVQFVALLSLAALTISYYECYHEKYIAVLYAIRYKY